MYAANFIYSPIKISSSDSKFIDSSISYLSPNIITEYINSSTGKELDLSTCNEVTIYSKVNSDNDFEALKNTDFNIFDPTSPFFNNKCIGYSEIEGIDMSITQRKKSTILVFIVEMIVSLKVLIVINMLYVNVNNSLVLK